MTDNQRTASPLVVGVGEVLWDVLPEGRTLGGAPANVAYHAASLGARAAVAGCVGDDPDGREIIAALTEAGVDCRAIAVDADHPTGWVSVDLDDHGKATFTIHEDVAWDFLPAGEALADLAARAEAICYGSLAQRSGPSRETIRSFLAATGPEALRICDINLRPPLVDREIVVGCLEAADILKLNDDELPVICRLLSVEGDEIAAMRHLQAAFSLDTVILTKGADGSILLAGDRVLRQQGRKVAVADTVGAGDAFTAAIAVGLLLGLALPDVHQRAEQVAAYVCTQPGATPMLPGEFRLLPDSQTRGR